MATRLFRCFPVLTTLIVAAFLLALPSLFNLTGTFEVQAAPHYDEPPAPEATPDPLPSPTPDADLTIDVSTDQRQVEAGDTMTYTVVITNTSGVPVAQMVVTSTLPPSTTFVSDASSPLTFDPTTGAVSWAAGNVPANAILTATYQVIADQTIITDTLLLAEIVATSPDMTETTTAWEINVVGDPPSDETWITPEGGVLNGSSHPVSVVVGPDRITEPLYFEVGPSSASTLPPHIWEAFDLTATTKGGEVIHTFASTVTISVDVASYIHTTATVTGTPSLYWLNESTNQWERLPGTMDWAQRVVSGETTHFSTFGVGSSNNGSYGVQHLPAMNGAATDEFSGNSSYHFPFRLPSGPAGFGLNLGVSYSSEGANAVLAGQAYDPDYYDVFMRQAGSVGWGWSLTGLGSIVRVNSPTTNNANRVFLNFSGGSYELEVVDPAANPRIWRTVPESFIRIEQYLSADGQGGYLDRAIRWDVTTPDGIRFIFGDVQRNWTHPSVGYGIDVSSCHKEFREVYLTRIIDTHGNTVKVDYLQETATFASNQCSAQPYVRAVRPMNVYYFPAGTNPDTGFDTVRTSFVYATRSDTQILNHDSHHVQRLFSQWRLQEIVAEVRDSEGSDPYTDSIRYTFDVSFSSEGSNGWGPQQKIMLLTSITEHGRLWRNTGNHARPPTTFEYSRPDSGYGANFLMLWRVKNGQGGSVSYGYQKVTDIPIKQIWGCAIPSVGEDTFSGATTRRFRVQRMEVWNGMGDQVIHRYEALNAAGQPDARAAAHAQGGGTHCSEEFEFGGFQRVRHDIEKNNSVLSRTITSYHQAPDQNSFQDVRKGHPYRVQRIDPTTGELRQERETLWVAVPTTVQAVYWIRKFEDKDTVYEPEPGNPLAVLSVVKITQYGYEAQFGNVIEMREYGANTIRRMTTEYRFNPTLYVVNRPFQQKLWEYAYTDGSGQHQYTCRQHTQFAYDTQGYGAVPTFGDLTHTRTFTQACDGGPYSEVITLYDSWGNPTHMTDPLGHTTRIYYDTSATIPTPPWPRLFALPLREDKPVNGSIQLRATYEWDAAIGQVLTSTAPNEQATVYSYDEWARLLTVKKPLDADFTQRLTYYDYFTATLPVDQRKPYMVKTEQRTGSTTVSYSYTFFDGLGRELQTITPFYTGTQSTLKWAVTLSTYHGLGGVERVYAPVQVTPQQDPVNGTPNTIPYFEPSHPLWQSRPVTQTDYDAFGQVRQRIAPDGSATQYRFDIERIPFPEWNHTEVAQLKQTIIDANANSTHYYQDSFGRLRAVDEVSGTQSFRSYYNYTIDDHVDVITDSLGHATRIVYDVAGRKIEMRDPDMGTWYYVYDAAGNLIRQRDSRNHRTCLYYDAQHRLTGKQYRTDDNCPATRPAFSGNVIHYNYDGVGQSNNPYAEGRRTEMKDGSGSTRWWYDERGRLTKEEKVIAVDSTTAETFVTDYAYDSADRPLTVTYPDHPNGGGREILNYTYSDPMGQWLRGISSNDQGILASGLIYNRLGQITDMDLHATPMVHQAYRYWDLDVYKGAGRLRSVLVDGGDQVGTILQLSYSNDQGNTTPGYDAVGNITSIWEKRWPRYSLATAPVEPDIYYYQQQRMSYDDLDRLISYQAVGGPSGSGLTARETYGYDAIGNLIHRELFDGQPEPTRFYSYDAPATTMGCPGTAVSTPKAHAVYSTSGRRDAFYCYDPAGNMVYRADEIYTQTLTYDVENRLIAIAGTGAATFVYDGDGNRVKTTINGMVTLYVSQHTEYEVGSETLRSYYYLGARRVAIRERVETALTSGDNLTYLIGDHLGSASVSVHETGLVIADLRYNAWGEQRCCTGGASNTPTQRRFTGQIQDEGTGFYFYNARSYDPSLGRFAQADTIIPESINPQSFNRFSYVYNSPLRYVDPTGHLPEETVAQFFGYTGAADPAWLAYLASLDANSTSAHLINMLRQAHYGDVLDLVLADGTQTSVILMQTDQGGLALYAYKVQNFLAPRQIREAVAWQHYSRYSQVYAQGSSDKGRFNNVYRHVGGYASPNGKAVAGISIPEIPKINLGNWWESNPSVFTLQIEYDVEWFVMMGAYITVTGVGLAIIVATWGTATPLVTGLGVAAFGGGVVLDGVGVWQGVEDGVILGETYVVDTQLWNQYATRLNGYYIFP